MRSRLINICIVAGITFSSCQKYLDIKPKGSYIPVTVSDFDHLLDYSNGLEFNYQDNNRGCNLSLLTDNLTMTTGQAQAGYILSSSPNIGRYYSYIFRQPYKDPIQTDYFWGTGSIGTYSNIAYFNNTIDGINSVPNKSAADQELAKASIAQALVGRAWCYFNNNLIYGPVYKPGGNNNTRTIPYVTSSDLTTPMPDLSTSEEMMKHIFKDLHQALPDLPVASSWSSRANKATGYAMMAYYHLFTQKYDSVTYYANLAWTTGTGNNAAKVIYDFNTFSWATPSNPQTSLITNPQDGFMLALNSREILFYRGSELYPGQGAALSYPSDEMLALYDQANDLRFKYFYINVQGYKTTLGGGFDDGIRYSSYRSNKSKITEGFSYPEVLLMRAEGYARTNQLSLAIADLNTLRQFRYKTGTPALTLGSQTQDQVIQAVLDERRRELPIGGIKRFMDLKRLVLDTGKPWSKTQVTHQLGTQTYTGTVDSQDFILTISNPYLQYNPGWGIPLDTRKFQ